MTMVIVINRDRALTTILTDRVGHMTINSAADMARIMPAILSEIIDIM